MGPQKQLVPIAFAAGIDTKTDPKQLVPGKLVALQNGVLQKTGQISRRWGYDALGKSVLGAPAPIAACKALDTFNKELLLFDGQQAYSYIKADDAWANRGRAVSLIQTNKQIVAGNAQQLSPDFATLNGVDVFAWEDSRGGIRYSAADSTTGTFLATDLPLYASGLSTDRRPKCIAWRGSLYVFFATAAGTINFVTISTTNPAAVAPFSSILIAGPLELSVLYDVAATSTQLIVTYSLVAGAGSTYLAALFTSTLFSSVFVALGSSGGHTAPLYSVAADSLGRFWASVALQTGTVTTYLVATSGSILETVTAISAVIGSAIASLGTVAVPSTIGTSGIALAMFVESVGSQTFNNLIQSQIVFDNGTVLSPTASAGVFARSVGLASKPVYYAPAGGVLVNVAFQSQQQSTYFTLDSQGTVVGKVFAGLCGGLVANSDSILPECVQTATGIFKYANLIRGQVNSESGNVFALLGVNATTLDFFDSNAFLSTTINNGLYTVGGVLQSYDGAQYVEHGFHVYPEAFAATPSGSGGLLGTGAYFYCVTYEWNDNNDLTQISTPSQPLAVTFGSGTTNSVSLQIPTLRLTKKSQVKIVVYRTQANGTLLYRVTSALAPTYNNPAVDFVTFVDVLSDTSIASNGAMYTQPLGVGGNPIVPNSAPPACSLICAYANRLFIAGLDNAYQLWYTQPAVPSVPMQFSALLTLQVDPDGGPITAIARQDANLIVFKRAAIFYISGNGPTATGDNSDFGQFVQIPSGNVGCVSQSSVVQTPIGLLFQSANGIYLLDRAGNVTYKGAPVENFNALVISSATLIPNQWVVFTTATGTALVYDYFYDQWSSFTNHASVDGVLYQGNNNLFAWASPTGTVFQQNLTSFSDAGVAIPFYLKTSWLSLASIQGYQRLYHLMLLGTYKGPHTLTVNVSYDFDDSFTAQAVIPATATMAFDTFGSTTPFGSETPFGGAGGGGSALYQFRVDLLRKCQTVAFELFDSQANPGNEGFALSSMGLVVGAKKPPFRLPVGRQFGAS